MESRDLFAAACLMFGLAMIMLKLRYGPGSGPQQRVPAPDIRNGRVLVSGLRAAGARKILADFSGLYDLDPATFAVTDAGGALQVTWKRPITTSIALYLVNYLTHPTDHAPSGTQPLAVGVIPVPAGIAPDGVSPGTLAKIFVPEGDTEHDLVHALTAGGRAFRISFTRMKWKPVAAPRAPALADKVAFALEG